MGDEAGAESGAFDPDLACLIDAWPALDDAAQVAIMHIIEQHGSRVAFE